MCLRMLFQEALRRNRVVGILRTCLPSSEKSRRHIPKTWQGYSYANISVRPPIPIRHFLITIFLFLPGALFLEYNKHTFVMDPINLSAIILPSASIVDTMVTFVDTVVIVFIMNATKGRY
ncbi:hypothetical protein F5146DRAFT_671631 [Armillaria mellea]|nr:hypothetical protein F5146DRAFT_671631 [Armillaria mellea]